MSGERATIADVTSEPPAVCVRVPVAPAVALVSVAALTYRLYVAPGPDSSASTMPASGVIAPVPTEPITSMEPSAVVVMDPAVPFVDVVAVPSIMVDVSAPESRRIITPSTAGAENV